LPDFGVFVSPFFFKLTIIGDYLHTIAGFFALQKKIVFLSRTKNQIMKKYRFIATLIFCMSLLPRIDAQWYGSRTANTNGVAFDSKPMKKFLAGSLYVLPTGDKTFDDSLILAVNQYWKITPVKVLKPDEVEKYFGDENNYFITTALFQAKGAGGEHYYGYSPLNSNISSIAVIKGGKHNPQKHTMNDPEPIVVRGFLFNSTNGTKYNDNGATGLGYMVKRMNDEVNIINTKKLNPDRRKDLAILHSELCKNAKILKNKTLLILDVDLVRKMNVCTIPQRAIQVYKYTYKAVPLKEAMALLNSEPSKYCYFAGGPWVDIYDPETKSVIFVDYDTNGTLGVSKKQFGRLNNAIDGIVNK